MVLIDQNQLYQPVSTPSAGLSIVLARLRVLIGKLYCFRKSNTRSRVMRFTRRPFLGTGISPQGYMTQTASKKVSAWANRIRRYKRLVINRYSLNHMSQSDGRWVYWAWERPPSNAANMCHLDDVAINYFWRSNWSVPVCHAEADCMRGFEVVCETLLEMEVVITPSDVARALRRDSWPNWKSPGLDGLQSSLHTSRISITVMLRIWVTSTVSNNWYYPPAPQVR